MFNNIMLNLYSNVLKIQHKNFNRDYFKRKYIKCFFILFQMYVVVKILNYTLIRANCFNSKRFV